MLDLLELGHTAKKMADHQGQPFCVDCMPDQLAISQSFRAL